MPVTPATQEAEAVELLKPGGWRLQWAEISPLYSSLDKSEILSQKTNKSTKTWFGNVLDITIIHLYFQKNLIYIFGMNKKHFNIESSNTFKYFKGFLWLVLFLLKNQKYEMVFYLPMS